MDVKVGQVWKSSWGTRFEVVATSDKEFVLSTEGGFYVKPISRADAFMMDCVLVKDSDPEPSDLEIVQKALDKTGLELRVGKDWILVCGEDNYDGDDALEVYYEDWKSLLTWAKQTINGGE